MVPPKKNNNPPYYSAPFLGFSTLIRAPLPSRITRTVGTLFYRYIFPEFIFEVYDLLTLVLVVEVMADDHVFSRA
jgi:hypothetical protein